MLTALKNNRSLTFYQSMDDRITINQSSIYAGSTVAVPMAERALSTQTYTTNVNQAFSQLKTAVIKRGIQYANNDVASRGGYMAENFVTESYNLDAVIKKKAPSAMTPGKNTNGSADVVYDGGKEAGLKFNANAKSSARAQTDPKYAGQDRVVPADQVEEAKKQINSMIDKNLKKNRTEAAAIQQEARDNITDRIRGDHGVESTPLTKKQDLELAKSIKKDENNQIVVDQGKINKVLKDTGITKKVDRSILKNELSGLGIAVAIGAGVGLTIGFITTLAQSGITPDSLRLALMEGTKASLESGALSAVSYGIGRTIGQIAVHAITGAMENAGINIMESIRNITNIPQMVNMGAVGAMTIAVFSTYQFVKLKLNGMETKTALLQVGKQVLFSLSVLVVSIIVQGIWGGAAGMIVSISAGIIVVSYSALDAVYQRDLSERIRKYTIERCYPPFA